MAVTFDPHIRLKHLESYLLKDLPLKLPFPEARIQLLRCRVVGYSLAAELLGEGYTREHIDEIMAAAYQNLQEKTGREVVDPYSDPCASQYALLDELRSYTLGSIKEPFMIFLRAEFKKVFVPTCRLLTELCKSEKKYSWEEVKSQLQEIMEALEVPVDWEECEAHLQRYMEKVGPLLVS
jgi:hypothetical protein